MDVTVVQVLSNTSRVGMGFRQIDWKSVWNFLDLAPISYIASEATCSAMMHVIKSFVYGKLDLVNKEILLYGLLIGTAMIAGNFIAMRRIKNVEKKKYQKIVAAIMIVVSSYLLVSSII